MSKNSNVACVFGYYLDEDSVYEIELKYLDSIEDIVNNSSFFQLPEGYVLVSFNGGYDNTGKRYAVGVSAEDIGTFLREALYAKPLIKQYLNNDYFSKLAPDPTPLRSWGRKFGLKFTTETPVLVTRVNAY